MNTVIVIGASHAGAEAVSTLRKKGWEHEIIIIGDEDTLPYHRPPLSKGFLSGDVSADQLEIRSQESYGKLNIETILKTRVTKINRDNKTIDLNSGESLSYSKLVLATGADVRQLKIEGSDHVPIHYLRTKKDVDNIKFSLTTTSKILVIGGGYIGLEVAASFKKLGHDVTVVEAMERVLYRVTSENISQFYQDYHGAQGVDIKLNTKVSYFSTKDGISKAHSDNGEEYKFDVCVIGIGVIPNTGLADKAGLSCENGVLVNQFCQTSDPNIYAIGDCANFYSKQFDKRIRLESVPNAVNQAKVAAMSICGLEKPYIDVPWFWSDQYDIKLQTAGLFQGYDHFIIRGELKSKKFAIYYFKEDRLIAVDAINSPPEYMVGKKIMEKGLTIKKELLANNSMSMKDIFKTAV